MSKENELIQRVTRKVVDRAIEAYGDKINRIILYGSYARGDFTSESDVDVMILINCKHEELSNYRRTITKIASDISLDDDIEVSVVLEDIYTYQKWLDTLVFYQNVNKDGVVLYE